MATTTFHMINNDVGLQTLKTRAGDVFVLGAYLYPKVGNTGGGTVKLNLHCTNSTGSPAATDVTVATETVPATGSWTYLQGSAVVPANYDTVDPQIVLTSVPVTDIIYFDDLLVREVTWAQNVLDTLYQNITGTSTTGNTMATLGSQVANWINKLFGTTSVQTAITATAVPALDASKITTGTFAQSFVTGLTTFINNLATSGQGGALVADLQTIVDNINKAVTGSATTGNAITTFLTNIQSWMNNLWGANTLGTVLKTAAVPSLDASKITTGQFAQTFLNITSIATNLLTGNVSSNNLPQVVGGQTAPNMVLSPDFETTTLWTGATGSQTTLQAHSGTHSWQLQGAG